MMHSPPPSPCAAAPLAYADSQLDEWIAFSHSLADTARTVTLCHFRTAVPIEIKGDSSPVTLADQQTEQALREAIRNRYPSHGIYGEEGGLEQGDAEWRWVIDPIDGTKAFISGIPTFVTLLALCFRGVPVLGIIDQPFLQERWVGAAGRATQLNLQPLQPPSAMPDTLSHAVIGTTDPTLFSTQALPRYQLLRAACGNQLCGGDGYLYARLCSGLPHLVCESGLKPHDFAALRPVIEGAGGTITDWQGQPLTLHSTGDVIAASSAPLHQAALQILQQ